MFARFTFLGVMLLASTDMQVFGREPSGLLALSAVGYIVFLVLFANTFR